MSTKELLYRVEVLDLDMQLVRMAIVHSKEAAEALAEYIFMALDHGSRVVRSDGVVVCEFEV